MRKLFRKNNTKLRCPCCNYKTLKEFGNYDICPVCFWEDDGVVDLDIISGPNHISLRQAQRNFMMFGGCDEHALSFVRKPKANEY
ncbi:hypothetical protein G7062_10625 [Erysipelothrix sp. HDW6C]|uniref:CPCC family cysteine-rich protein n=1 Tax=Erysipelothrix sp. HDW6C TaxID=2714930 RepID=UPI00140BF97F|nr:CPCC family cysteine-rich protein [Erysipelothrix sp. HDW6C]QIK70725.1 hypothetical protein G7062_10625 [Erysipelothrix sp. HDW6C]